MSVETRLRFFSSKSLGRPGSLEAALEALRSAGFTAFELRATEYQEEGCFDQTQSQVTECLPIAYASQCLTIDALNEQVGFEVFMQMRWTAWQDGKPHETYLGAVSFQSQLFFSGISTAEFYSKVFLDLGRSLYDVLSPDFGWLDFSDPAGHTSESDVKRLALPHVYWANFFGPCYVNILGREHITSAPGWLIEDLDDGGMLYVVTSALGFAGENQGVHQDARSYFGVA